MISAEDKVISVILGRTRSHRESQSAADREVNAFPSVAMSSGKLREAQFSDFDAVTALKKRWGIVADSFENWERLWRDNPALQDAQCQRPMGWVLEAEGEIVGYLGNVSLSYSYRDRLLTAVTGSGLVVEPAYRAVTLSLIAAFYRQKSIDLYLTTTAVEAVGKIARAFKSDPLPQKDYGTTLFWVLQPYPFAQGVMEKLKTGPLLSRLGSLFGTGVIGTKNLLGKRWPKESSTILPVSLIGIGEIGGDFDALWRAKRSEGPRLLADRSSAALRWHFEIPGDSGSTSVLCCRKNGELLGYAIVRNGPSRVNGLRRSLIADMVARQDDPKVLKALCVAAYHQAKRAGSHVLEILGFPSGVREIVSQWSPYQRSYPACPFYYKAADSALHRALADSGAWYASPFDGDTTLMP
ncbi:MAG: hypothetical protein ACYC92_04030 [Candidatus Acidiferrales bacterium]